MATRGSRDIPIEPVLQRGILKGSLIMYIFNIYYLLLNINIDTPPGRSFSGFHSRGSPRRETGNLEGCPVPPGSGFAGFQFFTPCPASPKTWNSGVLTMLPKTCPSTTSPVSQFFSPSPCESKNLKFCSPVLAFRGPGCPRTSQVFSFSGFHPPPGETEKLDVCSPLHCSSGSQDFSFPSAPES